MLRVHVILRMHVCKRPDDLYVPKIPKVNQKEWLLQLRQARVVTPKKVHRHRHRQYSEAALNHTGKKGDLVED